MNELHHDLTIQLGELSQMKNRDHIENMRRVLKGELSVYKPTNPKVRYIHAALDTIAWVLGEAETITPRGTKRG